MTYKEAVSLFKTRYRRFAEKNTYEMQDGEIITELSAIQSHLQNKYYLSVKSSADNSTAQTTLIQGTATYSAGTTATTIPNDILQILEIYLNDSVQTRLLPAGIMKLRDTVKTTSKPYRYALTKQNTTLTLELDTYPDSAYTMTMIYVPRYDIYTGAGGSNTTNWSDLDYTASGFGGSLKLPSEWDLLVVEGAIANVTGDMKLKEQWMYQVKELVQSRPFHFTGEIPYDDGTISRKYKVIPAGYDLPYSFGDNWQI